MLDPHRGAALERVLAGRICGAGNDRHPGSAAARRGQQAEIEFGHRGKELTGADEGHETDHGRQSLAANCPATLGRLARQRPTLPR